MFDPNFYQMSNCIQSMSICVHREGGYPYYRPWRGEFRIPGYLYIKWEVICIILVWDEASPSSPERPFRLYVPLSVTQYDRLCCDNWKRNAYFCMLSGTLLDLIVVHKCILFGWAGAKNTVTRGQFIPVTLHKIQYLNFVITNPVYISYINRCWPPQ